MMLVGPQIFQSGEYDGSYEAVSVSIIRLAHAEREEGSLAVDPPGADPHGVPAHLVQDHPDPVDLVSVD